MIEPDKKTKSKSKKINYVTIPVLIAFLVGAGLFLYQRRSSATEYNNIITELVNQRKFKEGAAALEEFIKTGPSHMMAQAKKDLAICYRSIGQDPGLSHAQRVGYLKKAQEAAPGSLNAREMELIRRPANIGGTVDPGSTTGPVTGPATPVAPADQTESNP
jgi:hypothetical protein